MYHAWNDKKESHKRGIISQNEASQKKDDLEREQVRARKTSWSDGIWEWATKTMRYQLFAIIAEKNNNWM